MSHLPSPHALGHALAMATLLLAPATGWAATEQQAGVSAAVRGSVLQGELGSPDAVGRAVANGDAVYPGTAIKVGPAAGMQLMLLDQTTITLGENAELAVDEFAFDPAGKTGQISMKLNKGAFRLVTGGVSDIDPANTRISTPSASLNVRGTIVMCNVSAQGTLVALGGPGHNRSSRDRVGAVEVNTPQGNVSLTRPGFATFIAFGKAPEAPRPLTPAEAASLSGGLTGGGGGGSQGGSGSTAGAAQASEASGTSMAEGADAASMTGAEASSTASADDQSQVSTQSSGYGSDGAELISNPLARDYPRWADLLQEKLGSSFSITQAADLASLSGTASYTKTGLPLYDLSALDDAARERMWLAADFTGMTQVGRYDFSAQIDFALRQVAARWSDIVVPGTTGYLVTDYDNAAPMQVLLAFDQKNVPVYRLDGTARVPTNMVVRMRGAFINSASAPNTAPGVIIEGIGISARDASGAQTALYGGGAKVFKDATAPKAVTPKVVWRPAVTTGDCKFQANVAGPRPGEIAFEQGKWPDLVAVDAGATRFSAKNIPLEYKDAADDPWSPNAESHFDFSGTINFTERKFVYGLGNVVLHGTRYGDSTQQTVDYARNPVQAGGDGTVQSGEPEGRTGDAIEAFDSFSWRIGEKYYVTSMKLRFYNDITGTKDLAEANASLLSAELFLNTPGRLYHGTSQMNGTYYTPVVDTVDPVAFLEFLDITNVATAAQLDTLGGYRATFSAEGIPLEQRPTGSIKGWASGKGSYDFLANVNFDTHDYSVTFRNIDLGTGVKYAFTSAQTHDSNVSDMSEANTAFAPSLPGSTRSWQVNLMNDADETIAVKMAQQLFVATNGTSYRGQSLVDRTALVESTLAVDPYDLDQAPESVSFGQAGVQLLDAAEVASGTYDLRARVSFLSREITTTVDINLDSVATITGTSVQDFSSEIVKANTDISLLNQTLQDADLAIAGVTLNQIIHTLAQPSESTLDHDLVVVQSGVTYTGSGTASAAP